MTEGKTAAIVANGSDDGLPGILANLSTVDMIIAADGGADACWHIGVTPTLIVGDLDSITDAARQAFEAARVPFITHPADKDSSDLELAITEAVSRGAERIAIYCAMGGRWDMTAANMFLLMAPCLKNTTTIITDGRQHIRLLRAGDRIRLKGRRGDTLSLIPVGAPALGVNATGVVWPLKDDVLYPWQTRGVSNRFAGTAADIALAGGCLLCIHTENTMPQG
ncbi:MAG: thiamine diphosphokinase [Pseudomonadota bacterium]